MTVVDFRRKIGSASQVKWRYGEIAELMRLCLEVTGGIAAESYAYGETDCLDPQFYVITSDPGLPSIICVSRILNSRRNWYVIANGRGNVLAEGSDLSSTVDDVVHQISRPLGARTKTSKLRHMLLARIRTVIAPSLRGANGSGFADPRQAPRRSNPCTFRRLPWLAHMGT